MAKRYHIDSDLRLADWMKSRTWDLSTDVDEFLVEIGGREQLAGFMKLPAAQVMPQALRAALGL